MFSKNKNKERIDSESREQYDYARRRIAQKKKLMRHFVAFLAGSVLIIILSQVVIKNESLPSDWWVYAILVWVFIFLIHVFNVFITNKFMGKEWEDRQLEKLKSKQEARVAELKKQAMQEVTVKENKIAKEQDALKTMTRDTQTENAQIKSNPNQLPPEQR